MLSHWCLCLPRSPGADVTLYGVPCAIVVLNTYWYVYPLDLTRLAARSLDVKINGSVEFQ
jgi:hypothetical protein